MCSDCEAYGLKKHGLTRSDIDIACICISVFICMCRPVCVHVCVSF